ncbi:hypothetical protein, partial [Acetobacter oeni]|uniref:hypothetical protein n=2 Tax=Acetobacter oeni TaxID=304077 RepID=UPI0011BE2BB3
MVEDSPSRGKFWKLPSGSAAGDWYPPVRIEGSEKEEWFYTSVRFPDGIEKTSLTAQDSEVQQLVVSWWFILNYRKSEADEPLHYDGSVKYDGSQRHDGTQRGQDFSIKPLESVHVLTNEFRPALSDERIASLAQLFPGVWEPIGPVMPLLADTDHSPAATKAAIPKGLDALAEQIEHLPAQDEEQPWTGSNHPPEPLDEPEPPPI